MKILVIGGVAAGTKTAAKLKREDRTLDVDLLTRDRDISYAGCGLPYYVGGLIESSDALVVNTPEKYAALTGRHRTYGTGSRRAGQRREDGEGQKPADRRDGDLRLRPSCARRRRVSRHPPDRGGGIEGRVQNADARRRRPHPEPTSKPSR